MIAVVHTGGYAGIQVKHRRDIKLTAECLFFNLLRAAFFSVLQFLAYL